MLVGVFRYGPLDGLVPGAWVFKDKSALDAAMTKQVTLDTDSNGMAKAIFQDAVASVFSGGHSKSLAHWDATDSEDGVSWLLGSFILYNALEGPDAPP